MSEEQQVLPQGWVWTKLNNVATINPRLDISTLRDSTLVSFIPMAAVEAGTGHIDTSAQRQLNEVKRGFTSFQEGDVLFAKITPCMENGKSAVAHSLSSGIGFGSTEFHVLRPSLGINPQLLYYYISQGSFRQAARTHMTGSAGQLRVPASYLAEAQYPLAPLLEQQRIVAAIEQQFTRLDAAVAALKQVQTKLKRYRAAVLKAAVEGKLTESWRAEHPATESASQLLEQILNERRTRWEDDLRAKGKDPAKVKYIEPAKPDTENLSELPEAWCWVVVGQLLIESPCNGISIKGSDTSPGVPALRLSAMSASGFDYDDRRYIPISEDVAESLAIREGDYFVSRGNGSLHLVGRGTFAQKPPERIVFPDTMIRLRFVNVGLLRNFIACIWSSAFMRTQIETKAHTTAGIYKISQPNVESFILPLPPILEQEQIVAEVEQRLSVVAQLEAIIQTNLKRAEQLRQSILREAFAGRLVPQDPDDEPASVLLERIRKERDRRKKETASNGRYVHVFDEPVQKINVEETQQTGLWESVGGARIDKEYIS